MANNGSYIFAGTEGGVYVSTNNGSIWTPANNGLTNMNIYSLATVDSNIFAGTNGGGIFMSTNNGANWTSINTGLGISWVYSLTLGNFNIYAGTIGEGVYRRPISEVITDLKSDNQSPSSFGLYQNYPNPFNPSTVIRYQLAVSSAVRLKIYNALGQEVVTLVNARQSAGRHEVMWNGKDNKGKSVSSGVYLYRLQAGDYSVTRKMVILR